jgi:membrane protease YdiL (CAAX protease family)
MKHWWVTYILVLGGLLVLLPVLSWAGSLVPHKEAPSAGETPQGAMVGLALFLLGAHCVAMFAAKREWRRRALYVVRLPWTAAQGAVLFIVLLIGPQLVVLPFVALGEAPTEDKAAAPAEPTAAPEAPAAASSAVDQAEDAAEGWGLLAQALAAVVILVVIVRVMRSQRRNVWPGFGFGGGRLWRRIGVGVVAYVAFEWAVLPVLGTGIELLFNLIGQKVEPHEAVQEFQQTHSAVLRVGLLVSMLLTAPFFEEIIFRGVLLQTIKRYAGSAAAIVISAAIFAALHPSLYVKANIFFLALLFGYLFDRTGSIVPGMVLHFLFNATSAVALVLGS